MNSVGDTWKAFQLLLFRQGLLQHKLKQQLLLLPLHGVHICAVLKGPDDDDVHGIEAEGEEGDG